jgi:hypothetical protein
VRKDDLAEHSIPSPIPFEGDDEWDEHSRFEYWADVEYDSDGFNDVDFKRTRSVKPPRSRLPPTTSGKRKAMDDQGAPAKRLRTEQPTALPPIAWKPRKQDEQDLQASSSAKGGPKSFALLKDWRERFSNIEGFPSASPSGPANEEDSGLEANDLGFDDEYDAEEAAEDGEDDLSEEGLEDIDPEILRMALKKKLKEIGLGSAGIDEETLMSLASKFLTNQSDDVADELTEELLTRGEDPEKPDEFAKWVSSKAETSVNLKQNTKEDSSTTTAANAEESGPKSPARRNERKQKADSPVSSPRNRKRQKPDDLPTAA